MRVALIGRYRVPFPYDRHDVDHPMLRQWARELGRLDLFLLSRDEAPARWDDGPLSVHYAPSSIGRLGPPAFIAWACRTVARLHRDEPFDLLNGSDLWGGLAGLILRRRLRRPLLAQMQGEFFPPDPVYYGRVGSRVFHRLAQIVCRGADGVRCLHSAAAERVVSAGWTSADRVDVVPSRCDVGLFQRDADVAADVDDVILFVGNLVRGKGVDELLDAFAAVHSRHPAARLIIVGDGPRRTVLAARAAAKGIGDRVELRGRIPHRELPAVMARASMLVLPSYSEGTPRVILEAMAMQLPVVATSVGGIPDMVADGRSGLLVPAGSITRLAAAIERVLTDRAWARGAGIEGRAIVTSRFSVERHVAQMIDLHVRCARSWPVLNPGQVPA